MRTLLVAIWIMGALLLSAQAQNYEAGVFGGVSWYNGDLNPYGFAKGDFISPAGGFVFRFNYNKRWAIKTSFLTGTVMGNDALVGSQYYTNRNLQFTSTINEASAVMEFNFFSFYPRKGKDIASPYAFVGLGVFRFNPVADIEGNSYELAPLRTEDVGYSRTAVNMPFGFGFKLKVTHRLLLSTEWGMRRTWTDYIDDVSGSYPEAGTLEGLAADLSDRSLEQVGPDGTNWGTQRGDSKKTDWYTFLGVMLTIRIGDKPEACFFDISKSSVKRRRGQRYEQTR